MAEKVITAHELARQLLAGPDVEVWARNPSDESYPLYVKKIEGIGQYGSADDNEDYEEGDETSTTDVILLDMDEDDGFIE